jgi:hypothetical protein
MASFFQDAAEVLPTMPRGQFEDGEIMSPLAGLPSTDMHFL